MKTNKFNARLFNTYGFTRRKDLDFKDDGTTFAMYEYLGMPVTYAHWQEYVFIAVRPDYLPIYMNINRDEWYKSEEHKLADEFNYVFNDQVDMDKLVENIKKIADKIKSLL